jgi:predicted transcriptional regulator
MNDPRIIPVGQEPPPMNPSTPTARRTRTGAKPKGTAGTRERFAVLNAFIDCAMCGLGRNDVTVWLVLYRDTRDGTACTSQADIARRAGVAERTVRRTIGRLKRCGLVSVVYRGGIRRGPSSYRVHPVPRETVNRTKSCPVTGGQSCVRL